MLMAAEEDSLEPINDSIARGVGFLIAKQNQDGSWGGPTKTKGLNIYAPLPGAHQAFHAGAASLALAGLLDAKPSEKRASEATGKAAAWLARDLPRLRRADPTTTYNVWGHAYGLRAISRLYENADDQEQRKKWRALAIQQIAMANRFQDVNGGWGYLDVFDEIRTQTPSGLPTSFTTATMLLAMAEARDAMAIDLDLKIVARSLTNIRMQQFPDFAYAYSFPHRDYPRGDINRPAGSLSRSQVCNACLRTFGDEKITDEVLGQWAERFVSRIGFLSNVRKRPVPHEGAFKIAGYFFYYGTFYFTESIAHLSDTDQKKYAEQLAEILIPLQEKDGSWWDYPLYDYHQAYGTGYALMALSRCREILQSSQGKNSARIQSSDSP